MTTTTTDAAALFPALANLTQVRDRLVANIDRTTDLIDSLATDEVEAALVRLSDAAVRLGRRVRAARTEADEVSREVQGFLVELAGDLDAALHAAASHPTPALAAAAADRNGHAEACAALPDTDTPEAREEAKKAVLDFLSERSAFVFVPETPPATATATPTDAPPRTPREHLAAELEELRALGFTPVAAATPHAAEVIETVVGVPDTGAPAVPVADEPPVTEDAQDAEPPARPPARPATDAPKKTRRGKRGGRNRARR